MLTNEQIVRFSGECTLFLALLQESGRLFHQDYQRVKIQLLAVLNNLEKNQLLPDGEAKPPSQKGKGSPQDLLPPGI